MAVQIVRMLGYHFLESRLRCSIIADQRMSHERPDFEVRLNFISVVDQQLA